MTRIGQTTATTQQSGSANAATLSLGTYRRNVDILVDGSGSNWTVTVEHKDGFGNWIQHSQFTRENSDNDTLQIDTMSEEVRAYYDTDVNALTIHSKGDS